MGQKKPAWTVLAGALIFFSHNLCADPDRLTGGEWQAMSDNHKTEYVVMAADWLRSEKVPLEKRPAAYLKDVNAAFALNSDMPATPVHILLASIIYKNEPAARPVLDGLIKKKQIEIVDIP